MTKLTLRRIQREVRNISGDDDDSNLANRAGVVLLAALQVGTSQRALAAFTKFPAAQVRDFVRKAREQGIFTHNGKIRAEWFDENGSIALMADSLVLCGLMNRGKASDQRAVARG